METSSIKRSEITRSWFLVDAKNQTLGRLASNIAQIIRGKNKSYFTPHMDMGDFVIVINADKIKVTGKKETDKKYWRHTGFPGGQKETSFKNMRSEFPERIIKKAVKGMLPHNKLGRRLNKHLKVYAGDEHPHFAQKPEKIEFK